MTEGVCVLEAASRRRARVIWKVTVEDSGEMNIAPVHLFVRFTLSFLVLCALGCALP